MINLIIEQFGKKYPEYISQTSVFTFILHEILLDVVETAFYEAKYLTLSMS